MENTPKTWMAKGKLIDRCKSTEIDKIGQNETENNCLGTGIDTDIGICIDIQLVLCCLDKNTYIHPPHKVVYSKINHVFHRYES